jgi:hypothetical protein
MIDEHGLSFSEEKLREVLDFPLPTTHKVMKSFLGLANYFRDHVKDHSTLVKPLQDMVGNYKKNQQLKWTPELTARFDEVKKVVGGCPKLFFMDENLPIFLHTDASDYGMGAYCFQQEQGGPERPIAFISQSFTRERLRWSVPEKEAYIIYYAFQKLEYLLRDVYFVLRTDHKNLTYINSEGSAKVRRWKMAIQEFNFDIEHIAGVDNIVADALSRLCAHTGLDQSALLSFVEDARIPNKLYKLIASVHNGTAGHNGVEKTLEKLRTLGTESWPRLREHVKMFISECPICQKLDYRNVKNHTEPYTTASMEPFETLNIDSIGPVPTDDRGNIYILVIIDCFSRFVELYPIPDTSALHAARCILQHLGRYGAPRRIRTDNGSQFVNKMVDELIDMVGSEHQLSLAYSSEENAIVERANKEVMRHLILLDKRVVDEWSLYLPLVQRIMNASVHSALQLSPAQIIFGNAITLDRGIFREQKARQVDEKQIPLSEWAENMQKRQKLILTLAKAAQQATDDFHIVQASAKQTEYPINSYVLAKYRERPPTKFHSNWRGPLRVISYSKSNYVLQDLVTNEEISFHITQLKPFKYDEMETDPAEIARAEQEEFVVEAVLNHTKGNRRNQYEFQIKWLGFDDPKDIDWQPWENVKNNEVLNRYLYDNKLKKLLTQEQKLEVEAYYKANSKSK